MRDNLHCNCHICKVERHLFTSLSEPPVPTKNFIRRGCTTRELGKARRDLIRNTLATQLSLVIATREHRASLEQERQQVKAKHLYGSRRDSFVAMVQTAYLRGLHDPAGS